MVSFFPLQTKKKGRHELFWNWCHGFTFSLHGFIILWNWCHGFALKMKLVHVFQNMKPPNVIYKQRSTLVILVSCKKINFLVSFSWNWNFDAQNHASNLNFASTWMKLIKIFGSLYIEIGLDATISRRFFSFIKNFIVFHIFSLFSPVS